MLTQVVCIKPKISQDNKNSQINFQHVFIMTYSNEHRFIKQVLNKHGHVLLNDPYFEKSIPPKPTMIYRGAKTLKSTLAPSNFNKKNR